MKLIRNALFILGATALLAGCNPVEPGETPHEHTFDTEWTYSDEYHWKKATCEHTELTLNLGAHTYNDEGFCTACGKEIASHFKTLTFVGDHCSVEAEPFYHLGDTITFHVVPNDGYGYPRSIHVSKGLDSVVYDEKTGLVTGLVTDDIALSATSRKLNTSTYVKSIQIKLDGIKGYFYQENYDYDEAARTFTYSYTSKTKESGGTVEYGDSFRYTYNEINQLVKYERSYENGVYERYDVFTYNDSGTKKDKTSYKLVGEEMNLYDYETYAYDEFDRLTESINYDADCVTPSTKNVYTYSENTIKQDHMSYTENKFVVTYYEKQVTAFDQSKGTKTVTILSNVFPEEGDAEETVDRVNIYDLTTNKLIEFHYAGDEYYYSYNEMGDMTEKQVWQPAMFDDPRYQEEGMKIVYNDRLMPISGTYGEAMDMIYDESVLDFAFTYNDSELFESVVFNKKDEKEAATIKYEYFDIANSTVVPDTFLKAYEPGSYPSFPDTDIFRNVCLALLS